MSRPLRWLWIVPFAVLSGAAVAQSTSAIGSGTPSTSGPSSATGEIRGLGLPSVPNNRLAPLPGSIAPIPSPGSSTLPGSATGSTTAPAVGGATATAPAPSTSATPGVTVELAPPAPATAPGAPNPVRTCPPGITFC